MTDAQTQLVGKLLIAMPDMSDPRFARAVIFMCAHSDDGGMGLIVNKPHDDLTVQELLEQIDLPASRAGLKRPVYYGGPVDAQRGFVLHTDDYSAGEGTLPVVGAFCMTATLQVLEDMSQGHGPSIALAALGYAGWGPGQLEYEISQNGWLICDPDLDVVFGLRDNEKWSAALGLLGIDPLVLSTASGRA